jgi:Zn-dependent M28 family amino/carboxypeptidase
VGLGTIVNSYLGFPRFSYTTVLSDGDMTHKEVGVVRKRAIAALSGFVLASALIATPSAHGDVVTDSSALRNAVTLAGIRDHQAALQAIANANGGTRLAGTAGYDESADYVYNRLVDAGYSPVRQQFPFPFFQELAPPTLERVSPDPVGFVAGTDFLTQQYSGSGNVTAEVVPTTDIVIPPGPVASTSNSGCEASDFPAAVAGNIALIQRGTCSFHDKALNAQNADAVGVIIFNEGQPGRTDVIGGTLGSPDFTIPVVDMTFALGADTYNRITNLGQTVVMHLVTTTISETRTTENILASTATGRADRTVVAGAHLDSVAAGPGINDNGSGSATILEIAEQFANLGIQPRNRVLFAWWGAEEEGLLGSQYFVSQLSNRDIKNIAVNLNFDMLGSPNFVRFVYDGNGSDTPVKGPTGSANVEDVFLNYFGGQGLATAPTAFDGRSDYGPFIAVGIPAGGLFSGAEGLKTPAEVATYGGIAGVQYDPCYHQACDTFAGTGGGGGATPPGLGPVSLDELSDGVAHSVLSFATTTSAVPGTDKSSTKAAQNAASLTFWGPRARK